MPHVVGIDQSANHTGVCVLSTTGEVCELTLLEPKQLTGNERLAFLRKELRDILLSYNVKVGVCEGYSYNSLSSKFLLGEIGGITKLALFDHAEKQFAATPKQLKKFVAGRGGASKKDVINSIEKQWKVKVNDDNLADAYGLARIALTLAGCAKPTKRYQLEVLRSMTASPSKKAKKLPSLRDSI